jgi:hypothetical protein
MTIPELETAAATCHRVGVDWATFWLHFAVDIRAAGDSRLIGRLLRMAEGRHLMQHQETSPATPEGNGPGGRDVAVDVAVGTGNPPEGRG